MLLLENAMLKRFGSLADESIRLTLDTQELSPEDTLELLRIHKSKITSVLFLSEEECSIFKEMLNIDGKKE